MSGKGNPPNLSNHDVEAESTGDEKELGDDEDPPVELLVLGRAKRVTAGNRLTSLLEKEADDDVDLLFETDEEDVEFDEDINDEDSDVQLESSSEDEDKSPTQANDDLEGEKEIEQQDKAERQKKRKAQDCFKRPSGIRKRIKLAEKSTASSPSTPAPRPRKKSERVSWIPVADEGPTRSSSRKQTVQNKQVVHERMKEGEKRRIRQIKVMEAAAKRKEASKPKAMTQADRMADAARTEKKNARSLSRWEEAEKRRDEEQKIKLAALHNRQLEGPVITWWSGLSRWVNGKLQDVGFKAVRMAEKVKQLPQEDPSQAKRDSEQQSRGSPIHVIRSHGNAPDDREQQEALTNIMRPHIPPNPQSTDVGHAGVTSQGSYGFLDGIHYYASLPVEQRHPVAPTANPVASGATQPIHFIQPPPPLIEHATRNLVVLNNVDANALKIPEIASSILVKKRNGKIQSRSLCFFKDQHTNNRHTRT